MDFWRKSAGISRLERKTNTTIRNILNVTANAVKKIDEKRCRWYGQLKRMGKDRQLKLLMNWKTYGRNRRERSKKEMEWWIWSFNVRTLDIGIRLSYAVS